MSLRSVLFACMSTAVAAPGCSGWLSPDGGGAACSVASAVIDDQSRAILNRPFDGSFPVTNYFDHEYPAPDDRQNGFQRTFCGSAFPGVVDGHTGYDWLMPEGTPIRSASDGLVEFAGEEPPFVCGALGLVSGLVVQIRHSGESARHVLVYAHLSQVMVSVGDSVRAGDPIARSGNTGCSTDPHLHFEVWRGDTGAPLIATDPYGWIGEQPDPWSLHRNGAVSHWLWRPNEAPLLSG